MADHKYLKKMKATKKSGPNKGETYTKYVYSNPTQRYGAMTEKASKTRWTVEY